MHAFSDTGWQYSKTNLKLSTIEVVAWIRWLTKNYHIKEEFGVFEVKGYVCRNVQLSIDVLLLCDDCRIREISVSSVYKIRGPKWLRISKYTFRTTNLLFGMLYDILYSIEERVKEFHTRKKSNHKVRIGTWDFQCLEWCYSGDQCNQTFKWERIVSTGRLNRWSNLK